MPPFEYGLVIFIDIRGFTAWSSKTEVGLHLKPFIQDFYSIFLDELNFDNEFFIKPNGDGVIIVKTVGQNYQTINTLLENFVSNSIVLIKGLFVNLCAKYKNIMRCNVPLKLGIGINAGLIYEIEFKIDGKNTIPDYISGTLSLASRLCDLARPEGVVIAADAFPDWHPNPELFYQICSMRAKSYHEERNVWVSHELSSTHLPREVGNKVLEFHIGTICYEPDKNLLLLAKRSQKRALFPSLWETCGGHIVEGETLEEAAQRICSVETGLKIKVDLDASITTYLIKHERTSIPGIKFLCLFAYADFKGKYDKRQHTDIKLVPYDEFLNDKFWSEKKLIPGAKQDVMNLINRYKSVKGN